MGSERATEVVLIHSNLDKMSFSLIKLAVHILTQPVTLCLSVILDLCE